MIENLGAVSTEILNEDNGGSLAGFQLSSDKVNGALPGELLHADFMDAWDASLMDLIVTSCLNAEIDCGTRQISQFGLYDPSFLSFK